MTALVELPINANVGAFQNVYFQNQPQLQSVSGDRQVYIVGIETYSSLHMSGSPLTPGNPIASPADIINATLTLSIAGTLNFLQIPLVSLVRNMVDNNTSEVNNVHVLDVFRIRDTYKVDWTKSYVQTINAPGDAQFSYIFNVYYQYDNDIVD